MTSETTPDPLTRCRTCPGTVRQSTLDEHGRCGLCQLYDLSVCRECGETSVESHGCEWCGKREAEETEVSW